MIKRVTVFILVVVLMLTLGVSCTQKKDNDMELNALFTDNMVLQAENPVRIFGTGNGKVNVEINGKTYSGKSENGKWLVNLDKFSYGGPYDVKIKLNGEEKTLKDVYFGDVYLLAGQSNIQFKMKSETSDKLKWKTNENIRYFALDSLDIYEHYSSKDGWVKCINREVISNMSAIGYHVAMEINKQTDRAIGLIGCYQGASVLESWLPEEIANLEQFSAYTWDLLHKDHTAYAYQAWNAKAGILYHYMFEKILPFALSHVIFYQGESNTTELEATYYADMVTALIDRWRKDLLDDDLPFVLIQIADYDSRKDDGWKLIQDAQATVPAKATNVKLVVSKDVCASDNIHPSDKQALSLRIANTILGN